MPGLLDVSCKYKESLDGIAEVVAKRGTTFAAIYENAQTIADFSLEVKQATDAKFCLLPFCHTVEAEALGGDIRLGDEAAGTRGGELVYYSIEPLQKRTFNYAEGTRIIAMLEACRILKNKGERVIYSVSGPFSILSCLLDTTILFKVWRKDQIQVQSLFKNLSSELLQYIEKVCSTGVDYISYADPVGSLKILGPRYAEQAAMQFTVPFLQKVQAVCSGHANVFVCPLMAGSLTSLGFAHIQAIVPNSRAGDLIPACTKNIPEKQTILKINAL